jgi:hypothetical protein
VIVGISDTSGTILLSYDDGSSNYILKEDVNIEEFEIKNKWVYLRTNERRYALDYTKLYEPSFASAYELASYLETLIL